MKKRFTQVCIIGAGPAGLVLSKLLHLHGIGNIVLESRSRDYIENRLRAGLLEYNTVQLLKEMDLADNLMANGTPHYGVQLSFNGERVHLPFPQLTGGRHITLYGQRFVVRDLVANLHDQEKKPVLFEAEAEKVEGIESERPTVTYRQGGASAKIHCDYVVACDGHHGIGLQSLPASAYHTYIKEYPYSWLGILAETPPSSEELIYAFHDRGFALLSYRSKKTSRLYIQVGNGDTLGDWPDERIWEELDIRLGTEGWTLNHGPVLQKDITPLRSFMIDRMQHGRLFLAGDAAHIVPPTGAKGLNLAVADVKLLGHAFRVKYHNDDNSLLDSYSADALKRVWRVQQFSNFMTQLFHKEHPDDSFDFHLQKAQFDYIKSSEAMRKTIAENYVGLKEV